MLTHERRAHFRIDDHLYFEYRVLEPGELDSDFPAPHEILGEENLKYIETSQHFHQIDSELVELAQNINSREPGIAHYLSLLNAKIDYLAQQVLMTNKTQLRKVNISLGGMSFKTSEPIKKQSDIKILIYTKPKMIPIIIDASVVYCQYQSETLYTISVTFNTLSSEHEQLLSQHILHAQTEGNRPRNGVSL